MKALIQELLPHAPHLGLYLAPGIPPDKLRHALEDYAPSMQADEVVALFDATLMGSAKDGAIFAKDRFVFQNNNLEPAHDVRYADLVRVDRSRGLLKGAKVILEVNRGRATFDLKLDCSGKPEALDFLHRFLHEAMLVPVAVSSEEALLGERTPAGSDRWAVQQALDELLTTGLLAEADYRRLLEALG